ncbi:MAG TPA: hypothetical protein VGO67_13215 [Verrucomicrobiae bacterium]|jgi:hypothetical protein
MRTNATLKSDNQKWGIYHTDREYARSLGDPLRTKVETPTKIATEEAAAKLGFSNPWAHPVSSEMVELTDQILKEQRKHGQEWDHKPSRTIRI